MKEQLPKENQQIWAISTTFISKQSRGINKKLSVGKFEFVLSKLKVSKILKSFVFCLS